MTSDDDTLLARRAARNAQDSAVIESHLADAQVTSILPSLADLTVDGAMPIEEVVARIIAFIDARSPDANGSSPTVV